MNFGTRFKAQSRRPRRNPGEMNSLEREYAAHLDVRKSAGEIVEWKFERVKLKIAKLCYITVDFMVTEKDQTISFVETKGFMEPDALIKLKAIAEEFWQFRFILVKKRAKRDGGGFEETEIGA